MWKLKTVFHDWSTPYSETWHAFRKLLIVFWLCFTKMSKGWDSYHYELLPDANLVMNMHHNKSQKKRRMVHVFTFWFIVGRLGLSYQLVCEKIYFFITCNLWPLCYRSRIWSKQQNLMLGLQGKLKFEWTRSKRKEYHYLLLFGKKIQSDW